MSLASNKAYLKSITDKLKPIPRAIAARVGVNIFLEMLQISITKSGFDSGQAAANWMIDGYYGTPTYADQQILWGYGGVSPKSPAGYKGWLKQTDHSQVGDPSTVYQNRFTYATTKVAQLAEGINQVTVYNPIVAGFTGFRPGDDSGYEKNALDANRDNLGSAIGVGLAKGLAEVLVLFPFLKLG